MALPVVWRAQAGSQQQFLDCPHREVCYSGTRGPGKTDAILMAFAKECGKGYGLHWRGIIFRKEYKHLDDIVSKSKRWFNQIVSHQRPRFLSGMGQFKWIWPDGEELLFRAFPNPDSYWSFHGHEYPFIGFEELTGWPSIECYESMMSCNRSSFQPKPGQPKIPLMVRSTTNPYGVGHNWVKAYFIDPAPYGVPIVNSQGQKRVTLFGSVNENKFLDQEYVKTLNALTDPNKRKAWLYGSWDITSGGMFDDLWNRDLHVLPRFVPPATWRIDRSFDWGSSHPFSVGWWAESDGLPATVAGVERWFPRGTLIRMDEWYGCSGKPNEGLRLTAQAVASGIVDRETRMRERVPQQIKAGPADSSIYAVTDDVSIAQNMAKAGVRWTPADKKPGSRKNGWELIRVRLEAVVTGEDRPGMYVMDNCRDFLRTVPPIARDQRDPDDVDCFVAGTMVETVDGEMAIEQIPVGTLVHTPVGPREVIASYNSGLSKTVRVTLANGTVLEGTPHHKVFVEDAGLVQLSDLVIGLILTPKIIGIDGCKNQSSTTESSTTSQRGGSTIRQAGDFLRKVFSHFTDRFGLMPTDQYQRGTTFTISTTTPTTTQLRTWSWWKRANMPSTITPSAWKTVRLVQSWIDGEGAKQGGQHLLTMLEKCLKTRPSDDLRALIVECLLRQSIPRNSAALSRVRRLNTMLTTRVLAKFAESFSLGKKLPTGRQGLVVTSVVGCCESKPVFNLTVRQVHLYFANGVLVTNTEAEDHIADEVRYRCLAPKREASSETLVM